MSCSSCSSSNCCGTSNCSCTGTSCCGNSVPSVSLPYYATAPACQESHCQEIWVNKYPACLKVDNPWNVPDCGAQATLVINDATSLVAGSYLWHPSYGYFEVISFNVNTHQAVVQNNCNSGNADPGILVPACECFVVSDPPADAVSQQSNLYPFLALDFTAPANGACITITVTNVNGLVVGKNVQISTGIYRVQSILSGTTIEVCNDGDGLPAGTPVVALTASGDFCYPIILIDANQCTNPTVDDGAIVVCNSGISQILNGETAGMIPVLTDPATNHVEFQIVSCPTYTCTVLTSCLNIVSGTSAYTLVVADSSPFSIGNVLIIGSSSDRFLITNIPDATHIDGTWLPTPTSSYEIAVGTSVCVAPECQDTENWGTSGFDQSVGVSGTVTNGNSLVGNYSEVDISNPSICRSMQILAVVTAVFPGLSTLANANDVTVSFRIYQSIDGGSDTLELATSKTFFNRTDAATLNEEHLTIGVDRFVIPSASVNLRHKAEIHVTAGGAASYSIPGSGTDMYTEIHYIAVAV